jgi:hypothetical protein
MPVFTALPTPAELTPLDAASTAVAPIICKAWRRLSSELLDAQLFTKCLLITPCSEHTAICPSAPPSVSK